jgi:ankyrin repeat protein
MENGEKSLSSDIYSHEQENMRSLVESLVEAAVKSNKLSQVITLLNNNDNNNDNINTSGDNLNESSAQERKEQDERPLFFEAVRANRLSQVRDLLTRKQVADVDTPDTSYDDRTALMYAAERGSVEMVEMLLERGADPACESGMGEFALSIALDSDHDQVARILLRVAPQVHINRVYDSLDDGHIQFLKEINR